MFEMQSQSLSKYIFQLFTSLLFFKLFHDFFFRNFWSYTILTIVCDFGLLITRWHLKLHNLPHVPSSGGTRLILNPIWLLILTADSGWALNDVSYRVRSHGWLVALRGKLSDVARRGMIAFCRRKGALKNVNMLTVSKSGRSYIPGKPLSSDLRHIIIDKIIDGGGNPLTMIFPGRFVNLVSVEHASVLARDPLLPSQPCFLLCEYQYLRLAKRIQRLLFWCS